MKKLVLAVIDGMRPAAMRQAIESGAAPTLARLVKDGYASERCISSFPSLTPVATSTITTGEGPGRHGVPSMHWYKRDEQRYVDYGISFPAARRAGVITVLKDLVYRINEEHLSRDTPTIFERLEASGIRAACTTYMIYRGPHEHEFIGTGLGGMLAGATGMSRRTHGPSQLIYGDIFDSLGTPCRSSFGVPGRRDQHSACAAIELIKQDAYDFLLLSLPDNDNYSHRVGPEGQVRSIARADLEIQRVIDAAGGYRQFIDTHAMIVVSDHSHSKVKESLDLLGMLDEWDVLQPRQSKRRPAHVAVSPAARFGSIWVLDEDARHAQVERLQSELRDRDNIDQVLWLEGDEAAVASGHDELRFAPGSAYTDSRGLSWDVDGDLSVLGMIAGEGQIESKIYPDALARAWSALQCPTMGDVLVTPELGYEFLDWGGVAHVGGGTHGSLHVEDSAAQIVVTGTGDSFADRKNWSIADVYSLVLDHFGVDPGNGDS
jgi:hypothetical protein